MEYPQIQWIKQQLRGGLFRPRVRHPILEAYGDVNTDKAIVVALIINPVSGKSSLKFSEHYHQRQSELPLYNGVSVDLQFYYPGEYTGSGSVDLLA